MIMDKVVEVPEHVGAEFLTQKVTKYIKIILTTCGMEQALKPVYWLMPYPIRGILICVLHKIASMAYNWMVMKFFKKKSVYIFEKMGDQPTEVIVA